MSLCDKFYVLRFLSKLINLLSGKVMFGKATVTLSDITAGNGVVHAIDEVLFATPQMSTNVDDDNILTEMAKNEGLSATTKSTKKDNSLLSASSDGPKRKNLVDLCRDLGFTSFAAAMTLTGLDKVKLGQIELQL